jgi:hypothetical protein
MTQREKVLAGAVGLMVVLWAGSSGLTRYRDALDRNRTKLRDAEQQLSQARTAKLRGQRAQTRLRRWQRQSLPTNPDIANSLYQDWLQKQLTEAGLKVTDLKGTKSAQAATDRFQDFNFRVDADGELSQLVDFLSRFYRAGHLQRISRASITPAKENGTLLIELTIDARSMKDAPRSDKLTELESNVPLPPLEKLQAAISNRKLFAAFQKSGAPANEADQAFVSGMTQGENGWLMSVRMQDSGRMLYFRAGDSIQIGKFSGMISEIGERRAIVKTDTAELQVHLGQTLGQAQPLAKQAG